MTARHIANFPPREALASLLPAVRRDNLLDYWAQAYYENLGQLPPRTATPLVRSRYNLNRRIKHLLKVAQQLGQKPCIRVGVPSSSSSPLPSYAPRIVYMTFPRASERTTLRRQELLDRRYLITSYLSAQPRKAALATLPATGAVETEILGRLADLSCRAVVQGSIDPHRPLDLRQPAYRVTGAVRPAHALVHFGRWLLLEGAPGLAPTGGRPVDPEIVLKTVAALVGEHLHRQMLQRLDYTDPSPRKVRRPHVTRCELRNRWAGMFGEILAEDTFKSRMRSAERYLRAYLAQPAPAGAEGATLRSPRLEEVLGLLKTGAAQPAS